jgi:trans-aconitate 2-methyltransferase
MPNWSATQYLKFGDERTRPSRDLAARIEGVNVRRVVDLGCGPGNSTAVLAERWPHAELTGLDNSPRMIEAARLAYPGWRWVESDIGQWAQGAQGAADGTERFDVIFSNAALHWVPDHAVLLPQLMARVAPGGVLAFQMPARDSPAHRLMRTMAASDLWRDSLPAGRVVQWHSHQPAFYYDVLAPHASRLDLWETEYVHVMDDAAAIVEWYRGTGLRPYLDALNTEAERERFAGQYLEGILELYPRRADGRVLFPFRRVFAIACRS